MLSPGIKSMTSVEKHHPRTHPDCTPSDTGLLFALNCIQDSAAWHVRKGSMILSSLLIKSKSDLGGFSSTVDFGRRGCRQ